MEEVHVVTRIEGGKERFWIEEKKEQPQPPKGDEEPASGKEEVTVFEEDTPKETEAMNKMWLMDKVTSLERETRR